MRGPSLLYRLAGLTAACSILAAAPAGGADPAYGNVDAVRWMRFNPVNLGEPNRVIEHWAPAELEVLLAMTPPDARRVMARFGAALAAAEGRDEDRLERYLAALARARSSRLAARGEPWSDEEVAALAELALVDPARFAADAGFRRRVLSVLRDALAAEVPPALRDRTLAELGRRPEIDFELLEELAWEWGAIGVPSILYQVGAEKLSGLELAEVGGTIEVSLFSFSSAYATAEEALALLDAVHQRHPDRRLLVVADAPLRSRLEPVAGELGLELIDTQGRAYTPWVRDAQTFFHGPDGRLTVLLRPDRQAGREDDANVGRLLVQRQPHALANGSGPLSWAVSPVPFHNGSIVPGGDALWVSIHSLNVAILDRLDLDRVPVESFGDPVTVERFSDAAQAAAADLAAVFGRPVRFVHPLAEGADDAAVELFARLAGGDSLDLDSLVTLLPAAEPERPPTALVARVGDGSGLLAAATPAELGQLAGVYRLAVEGEELRARLLAAQEGPRGRALESFLELVAEHLAGSGWAVERLPLALVPVELVADRPPYDFGHFLLTWNNVVLDRRPDSSVEAEGFASLLAGGDRRAVEVFAAAGVPLALLPPVVESVRRNGGYRCSTKHLVAIGQPAV